MYRALGRLLCITIAVIGLAMGCSVSSEDENHESDTPPNIAGRWAGTWASTTVQQRGTTTMTISQQRTAITGDIFFTDSPCMTDGILEGTVDGADVFGTIDIGAGGFVETNGVIADAGAVLEGTYTVMAGQCTGEQGTFVFQRPVLNPNPNPIDRPGDDGDSSGGQCCKVCTVGKACGNSCISRNFTCDQPPGCACNG